MSQITHETILKTRRHFIQINVDCIRQAIAGKFFVNDLQSYIDRNMEEIRAIRRGERERSFTFAQRAHWIQTGECIPFLSK